MDDVRDVDILAPDPGLGHAAREAPRFESVAGETSSLKVRELPADYEVMLVEKKPLTLSDERPAQVKVRGTLPEPTVVVTVGRVTLTVLARDWAAIVDAVDELLP